MRKVLGGGGVLAESAFALRGPEERVFVEQRVGLGLLQPIESLLRVVFRIVVIAESERGPLAPHAGDIFVCEGGELFVRAGGAAMEITGEQSEIFLRSGVLGSGSVERGGGGVRFAACGAGGRFRVGGFFLFLFGLGGEIGGAEERKAKDQGGKNCEPGVEFCGVVGESLRPEGLSYRARGGSCSAA